MMLTSWLRERLTFANVMSVTAVFIALGGTAWAIKANSVGSRQIKANAVKTAEIANNAVTSPKVADGSLLGADFAAGQLPAGAQGPQGPAGPEGPPGPTASNAASANPEPDSPINPLSFSPLLATTVTTTTSSRVIGNASVQVEPAIGVPTVACQITIDGAFVGAFEQARLSATVGTIISLSQGTVVPAGSHSVAIACQQTVGGAGAVFAQGNITAIAVAE